MRAPQLWSGEARAWLAGSASAAELAAVDSPYEVPPVVVGEQEHGAAEVLAVAGGDRVGQGGDLYALPLAAAVAAFDPVGSAGRFQSPAVRASVVVSGVRGESGGG